MTRAMKWTILALSVLTPPAAAEAVKCRLGERTVYQEAPCPPGTVSLPLTVTVPEPDVLEADAARRRAEAAQTQLNALEQEREAREKAEREAAEAAAKFQRKQGKKQAKKCKARKATAEKKDAAKAKATAKPQDECPE